MTTTPTKLANIPHPAGATAVDEWADNARYFTAGSWCVDRDQLDRDILVRVDGIQSSNGSVSREVIILDGNTEAFCDPLTPAQARQLARALISAADECETMNGYDQID